MNDLIFGLYGLDYVEDYFNRCSKYPKFFPTTTLGGRRMWAATYLSETTSKEIPHDVLASYYWG